MEDAEADTLVIGGDKSVLNGNHNNFFAFAGIVGRNPKVLDIIAFITRITPHYKTVTCRLMATRGCRADGAMLPGRCACYLQPHAMASFDPSLWRSPRPR